jgi:hypothetical protein
MAEGEKGLAEAFLGTVAANAFAGSGSSPNGLLEPVLAEGCEVDREVDGVGQAVG